MKSTGEVIIADTNNSCLRQVSITNIISTLPMTVGPGLNSPEGRLPTTMPPRRSCFSISPIQGNHRIRRLDTATNAIVTVAGTGSAGSSGDGGQATAAQLNSPSGVAVDASGNLYIADTGNNKIRKVTAATGRHQHRGRYRIGRLFRATGARPPRQSSIAPRGFAWMPPETSISPIRITIGSENLRSAASSARWRVREPGVITDEGAATATRVNSSAGGLSWMPRETSTLPIRIIIGSENLRRRQHQYGGRNRERAVIRETGGRHGGAGSTVPRLLPWMGRETSILPIRGTTSCGW